MAEIFNQASLAYNDIITTSNVVSACYSSNLSICGSACSASYSAGDTITYSFSIVNNSDRDFSGLTLNSDLGAYSCRGAVLVPLSYVEGSVRFYLNGALQSEPDTDCSDGLSIGCLNIPAGGNALILYSALANQYAPLGRGASIANVTRIGGGCCCENAEASVVVDCASAVRLTISKSVCPTSITCGQTITYTLLIQNSGGTAVVATDNVLITDTFNPRPDITEVRFNGEIWRSPANYSYNDATGQFVTAAGQITVDAASFNRDADSGVWITTPGTSTLTITGTIACQ